MAVVKCSECGQRVSDKALACPHCGAPHAVADEDRPVTAGDRGPIYTALAVVVGIILVAKSCDTTAPAPPAAPAQSAPDLGASARHVCRQFIGQRGYKVDDWGQPHNWTTVANSDGSYSVGARVFGAAPGDVPRNLYLSCVVTHSGDSWQLQTLTRLQ